MMLPRLLHLCTLVTLVISQPLFDLLAANPQFFLVRNAGTAEMLAFLGIAWFLPATGLALTCLAFQAIHRRLGSGCYGAVLFVLIFSGTLQVANRVSESSLMAVLAWSLAGAAALVVLYYRWPPASTVLAYMAIVIPLAPLLFLISFYREVYANTDPDSLPRAAAPVPLVMVVFDELPLSPLLDEDGAIDAGRFPNFARLAARSHWYRNASTISDNTSLAVPALLSGNVAEIPEHGRIPGPTHANYPLNLFTLLSRTHDIVAFESVSRLCPDSFCPRNSATDSTNLAKFPVLLQDTLVVYLHILFPAALREHLPPMHNNWAGFGLGQQAFDLADYVYQHATVERFIESLRGASGNTLHFLHLMMPHHPWRFYPSGTVYQHRGSADMLGIDWEDGNHTWRDEPQALAVAYQRLSMQIAYADTLLGRILDALAQSDQFDQSLLVVTSDHGAEIAAGEQMRWAYRSNLRQVMAVPLFVKYPGQESGSPDLANVNLTDLLPTLDDVMRVDSGWSFQGVSLRQPDLRDNKVLMSPVGILRGEPRLALDFSTGEVLVGAHPLRVKLAGSNQGNPFALATPEALINMPVEHFRVVTGGHSARVRDLGLFESVDTDSAFVPGLLRTTPTAGDWSGEHRIAVALNGTLVAVTEVDLNSVRQFDVILPENRFADGPNALGLYRVSKNPDGQQILETINISE